MAVLFLTATLARGHPNAANIPKLLLETLFGGLWEGSNQLVRLFNVHMSAGVRMKYCCASVPFAAIHH